MSWHEAARCRTVDPDLFFAAGAGAERRAKAICGRCPVRMECLAFAIESHTEFGVWGGLNTRERRTLARRRQVRPALAMAGGDLPSPGSRLPGSTGP